MDVEINLKSSTISPSAVQYFGELVLLHLITMGLRHTGETSYRNSLGFCIYTHTPPACMNIFIKSVFVVCDRAVFQAPYNSLHQHG